MRVAAYFHEPVLQTLASEMVSGNLCSRCHHQVTLGLMTELALEKTHETNDCPSNFGKWLGCSSSSATIHRLYRRFRGDVVSSTVPFTGMMVGRLHGFFSDVASERWSHSGLRGFRCADRQELPRQLSQGNWGVPRLSQVEIRLTNTSMDTNATYVKNCSPNFGRVEKLNSGSQDVLMDLPRFQSSCQLHPTF